MDKLEAQQKDIIRQLKLDGFSEMVIEHWLRPRNFGSMSQYDGYSGKYTGPCGDSMFFWIKGRKNSIERVSYVTDICIGSITSASVLSEMVSYKDVSFAQSFTSDDLLAHMGGMPEQYKHCPKLAKDTFDIALRNYRYFLNAPWKRGYHRDRADVRR